MTSVQRAALQVLHVTASCALLSLSPMPSAFLLATRCNMTRLTVTRRPAELRPSSTVASSAQWGRWCRSRREMTWTSSRTWKCACLRSRTRAALSVVSSLLAFLFQVRASGGSQRGGPRPSHVPLLLRAGQGCHRRRPVLPPPRPPSSFFSPLIRPCTHTLPSSAASASISSTLPSRSKSPTSSSARPGRSRRSWRICATASCEGILLQ